MTALTVTTTTDYSSDLLDDISLISFANTSISATATFASAQFDGTQIHTNVEIDGTARKNIVAVTGGSVDASLWSLNNWASSDQIKLTGGGGDDTITGTHFNDTINGSGGNDTLDGGGG